MSYFFDLTYSKNSVSFLGDLKTPKFSSEIGPVKVNQKMASSGLNWIFFSGFQYHFGLEPKF